MKRDDGRGRGRGRRRGARKGGAADGRKGSTPGGRKAGTAGGPGAGRGGAARGGDDEARSESAARRRPAKTGRPKSARSGGPTRREGRSGGDDRRRRAAERPRPSAARGGRLRGDTVLRVLSRRDRPVWTEAALARELGLGPRSERLLAPVLKELEQEGRIERRGSRLRACRQDILVEATVRAPRRGAGPPVAVGEDGRTYALANPDAAQPGDRVLLEPLPGGGRTRAAEVIRVLEGTRRELVGIIELDALGATLSPYRDDGEWVLRVEPEGLEQASDGDVVVAVPAAPDRGEAMRVRVVEVLGPPGTPEADFRALVWRHRLPVEFPAAVLEEARALPGALPPEEIARRVDLREHPFVTIDPVTARDHDDAVWVVPEASGGFRLWVAIADVSYYVREGSALDREALVRGNSVYFPDRSIPMLPERLSSDLCSLREDCERAAIVAEMVTDARGVVMRRSLYPAVIRSRRRLSYPDAARVMEGHEELDDAEVTASLRHLAALAQRLHERRFEAGSIDFDLPSAEIVLGDEGRSVDIVQAPRSVAHRAVEEAMLAANRAVAEALDRAGVPALYRIHEAPLPDDVAALRELLAAFGLWEGDLEGPVHPREISLAIQRASGRPEERLVNLMALRTMRQARYAPENRGHFALAFDSYTHFTSPIRRYADLVVHRALRDMLDGSASALRRAQARAPRLPGIAARLSVCERVAEQAEREAVDLKKCEFMAQHVGKEFDGTITGVARHGFYVTLDDFFVEGLVHVSTLHDYVSLDDQGFALVASRSGERFALGDRVRVRVEAVNIVRAWINLVLLERLGEGPGATSGEEPAARKRPSRRREARESNRRRRRAARR